MGTRRDSLEGWTYTPETGWLRIPSVGYPADLVWPNIKPLADTFYQPLSAVLTAAAALDMSAYNWTDIGTITGGLRLSGTGKRITGDFNPGAPYTDHTIIQTSGANLATLVTVMPNGTATTSQIGCWSSSDPDNSVFVGLLSNTAEARLSVAKTGTGLDLPLDFMLRGVKHLRVNSIASVVNYLDLYASATGSPVTVAAAGTDTNISLALTPKGAGNVVVPSDLELSASGTRIIGDFSNATVSNRVLFQTSGSTYSSVGAIPGADGYKASFSAFAKTDPDNSSFIGLRADDANSDVKVISSQTGTGATRTLNFYHGESVRSLELPYVASAVNYLSSSPAVTGSPITLSALGTDTNIDIKLIPKGTGMVSHSSTTLLKTTVALTDGAGAAAGTLLNAPVAGNPTKWVPINDNGTTRYIPCW